MTVNDCTGYDDFHTRAALSAFVLQRAEQAADEFKFRWLGVKNAPSTYQQLRAAFEHSLATGEPLPVSNQYCESTVFVGPEFNVMYRFWHDVHHVKLGLSFNLDDELELAAWHLKQVEAAGYAPGSPVYELLAGDAIGQVLLMGLAGRFPIDQGFFSRSIPQVGLVQALLDEIRTVP